MTHASLVVGSELIGNNTIKVKKELESGWFQWTKLDMPASITIQSGLNKPRYASLKGIMSAKKKPIDKYDIDSLGLEKPDSLTKINKMFVPKKTKETRYIDGDTDTIVSELIKILRDDLKAIN